MEKFRYLKKVKEIYAKGGNIISYLKELNNTSKNSIEDILISYDFQSGSYIKNYSKNLEFREKYCESLGKVINKLGAFESLLELGVGEGTTLGNLIKYLDHRPNKNFGFDISWSRLKFAKNYLRDKKIDNTTLFTANLFEIPLLDNSIDVVYSSHSIEPNGGKEEEALKELYRITNKYLILLEPSFELGSEEAKSRMLKHGYVTKLIETAQKLDYNIIEHRLFDHYANPLNPTGLIIIEKSPGASQSPDLVCPITKTELKEFDSHFLYSKDSGLAYPVLDEIPCLLSGNSILAIHLLSDYEKFKQGI